MSLSLDLSFFRGKRILLTGHTGFKGSWMSRILINAGADLTGYSLCSQKEPSLFELSGSAAGMNSVKGDIRDLERLKNVFSEARPEIVIHMAAQPIVRESYANPVYTYETNVMGTVNVLECVKLTDSVVSFLNITTDKVYDNKEWVWGYRESDSLDGYDPYSNSKSCSELVTRSYRNSFFANGRTSISTARAGNVIGGGDFARDRIIPDCVRAAMAKQDIIVRNPYSTRPYQHVLEPLFAYLMIVEKQYADGSYAGSYNVGPNEQDCYQTGRLVDMFCRKWGNGLKWLDRSDGGPHEAGFLRLDCSKLKSAFGWSPRWDLDSAVYRTVEWYKNWLNGGNVSECMDMQINAYCKEEK